MKRDVAQRQSQYRQIADQVYPLNIDFHDMTDAHGQCVIPRGGSSRFHTKTGTDADEQRAENGSGKE